MNTHRLFKQIVAAAVASSSMLVAANAGAAPLPCVQRAIDWSTTAANHEVRATMVALHEVGIAAFATSEVSSSICQTPLAFSGCLAADEPTKALLSNAFVPLPPPAPGTFGGGASQQPFDIGQALPWNVTQLRANSSYISRLSSGGTNYDFTASCVGNLVVGNDQYGNHWTISLELLTKEIIK